MMEDRHVPVRKPLKGVVSAVLFVMAALVLVYIFPKERKFRYEIQKGKPWMHDILIAPYNFPIYKTENEMAQERDSIEKEANPYFTFLDQTYVQQADAFNKVFEKEWSDFVQDKINSDDRGFFKKLVNRGTPDDFERFRARYYRFYIDKLSFVYKKGIVKDDKQFKKKSDNHSFLVVVRNNVASVAEVSEIFTIDYAIDYIRDEMDKIVSDSTKAQYYGYNFFEDFNIAPFIKENLIYDKETSEKVLASMLDGMSLSRGMVQEGQKIITRGDMVDNYRYRVLESFRKEYESRQGASGGFYIILFGQLVLIAASILVLFLFLWNFRRDILYALRQLSLILILMVLFVFIGFIVSRTEMVNIYLVPFAILPIIIKTFYDARLALFVHIVTILLLGFLVANAFEFVFLQVIAGMIAIFSLASLKRRGKLFLSAFMVYISYSFVYFGMGVIQEGNFESIDWMNFAWFAGNGLLLLSSHPLIFIFEKTFGFLSDLTLMELTETNQPLLRKLNEKAPGTFQHSLQVANLAEEAAFVIGGNALLARTGALYHDVGKQEIPEYFIENQGGGVNPHNKLPYEKSAEIIISHVTKGIELARKYKIPKPVSDFILTHHGNSTVTYFYRMFKNDNPDSEIDLKKFSYPGMAPYSKETAIVMMVDSVEAASRSLPVYSEESISELVDNITAAKMSEGQFDEANITMRDITRVKEVLKRKLLSIYHSRISYPEEK